jgi:hypothetical protein
LLPGAPHRVARTKHEIRKHAVQLAKKINPNPFSRNKGICISALPLLRTELLKEGSELGPGEGGAEDERDQVPAHRHLAAFI